MGKYVIVEHEHVSGLPEDRMVNTFAFLGGNAALDGSNAATTAELDALADALISFYNTPVAPSTRAIDDFIGAQISRASFASTVKIYHIGLNQLGGQQKGVPSTWLGSPIWEKNFTLSPAMATTTLPEEVALALRWEASGRSTAAVEAPDSGDADTTVDRPRQRLTGRIYIGPLVTAINDGTTARPVSLHITDILRSGKALAETVVPVVAGSSMQLGVWSRKNAQIVTLEAVAVDNAFDTQRRRGLAPTLVTREPVV